jgi:phosphoenolpyruvate synthase/pyruvate phosphate dikinase
MTEILWLDDPGCDDPAVVGGKAANLARLMAVHPVPPGFCLPAAAYDRWAGAALPDAGPPEDLARLVEGAYAALGERCGAASPAVAVRSSAVDEDGAGASFAGIYTTYLNVRGAEAVLRAIARCWASAGDPRVKAYRERQGLSGAGVGVLVQELVAADAAAVVFSKNPTTGAADELVLNANWGLGESVVSGVATPDTWILKRPELSTLKFHLGAKEQMTILTEDGTREVPVLRTLRARPCLDAGQVQRVAELAVRLEETFGWPVDIETAYRGDKLYLLQCRPVTTGS